MKPLLENPTPGLILAEEFLAPLGLSQNALAQHIGVPANRLSEIVRGRRGVTADTDMRLARFFGLSEGYFLRLQNAHDLMEASRRPDLQNDLANIVPLAQQRGDRTAKV